MKRIIIAGSRDYDNAEELEEVVNAVIDYQDWDEENIRVVSGTARGADQLGEWLADKYDYQLVKYPAQWDLYGKSAGYKRNAQMAENADALIAFWDGKSRGTQHMIDIARAKDLIVAVYNYSIKQLIHFSN